MLAIINVFIVLGYFILTMLLFDHGTKAHEPLIRRLKFATLAITFMCFGFARAHYVPGVLGPYDWVFVMGHLSFHAFGATYFWTGYRHCGGETMEGRVRQERAKANALVSLAVKKIEKGKKP